MQMQEPRTGPCRSDHAARQHMRPLPARPKNTCRTARPAWLGWSLATVGANLAHGRIAVPGPGPHPNETSHLTSSSGPGAITRPTSRDAALATLPTGLPAWNLTVVSHGDIDYDGVNPLHAGLQGDRTHAMAMDLEGVRQTVERVFARQDMDEACRRRDLGDVIGILGKYGITQGQMAAITGIQQGRLSEFKNHLRVPTLNTIETFADGVGMPERARRAFGLSATSDTASPTPEEPGAVEPSDLVDTRNRRRGWILRHSHRPARSPPTHGSNGCSALSRP